MCGIAGVLHRNRAADRDVVAAQLRLLDHRGPDSWGVFAAGPAAVGQTRLSIIDLVTGDPPIATPDGTIGVAFNGEIYNYAALRDELRRDGHKLRTAGDTEVIVHLAEHLEPVEIARRLHGMFGAAVWDTSRQRLILLRDRLGKKPLYWWRSDDTLVFGTEIKAIAAHPAVTARLDPDAIAAYLGFGYVPTPRTFYDGIFSVPPGHVVTVDARDLSLRIEDYWAPTAPGAGGAERLRVSHAEAAALVRDGLRTAVERRLVSDVPVGAFLSGGVDSSAVVAMMSQLHPDPVRTFTIGFEDTAGFDERASARAVASHLGTDHVEFVVEPDAVELVERLVWHHDQPFGDSSAIPTYLLSELTSKHVTVALCGDGGDELFGGYERFLAGRLASGYERVPASLRKVVGLAGPVIAGRSTRAAKAKRFLDVAERGLPEAFREWIAYVSSDRVEALVPGGSDWARRDYQRIWDETAGAATLDRLQLLTIRTYLLDDLLPKVDRMSMAHGLEVRAPFLDHELVELALRLPVSDRQRGMTLKRVLKTAIADVLPPGVVDRPKHGFGVPLDRWFREDLATLVHGTLGSPGARVRRHVDSGALDALLAAHGAGGSHGHALWTLLTLEVFLRRQDW